MEKLQPSIEWKKRYEAVKNLLTSPVNYAKCFDMKEIQGKEIFFWYGEIEFPTGDILVRDPLVWLNRDEKAYLTSVPRGKYRIETLVVKLEEDHYRYALSRVRFTENVPKIYYEALKGDENLDDVDGDSIFGFNVDAGLATIVDIETRNAYCDFKDKWYAENPNKNIYDDFLLRFLQRMLRRIQFIKERVETG